jgi:hypothetical protein
MQRDEVQRYFSHFLVDFHVVFSIAYSGSFCLFYLITYGHLPAFAIVFNVEMLQVLILALVHALVAPAPHPVDLAIRAPGCVQVGANLLS